MAGKKGYKKIQKSGAKAAFIDAFKKFGFIYQAADAVGVSRHTILDWRKQDPEFEQAIQDAEIRTTEMLEKSALSRALIGEERSIYHNGRVVGSFREKSDTLTIFLLKARDRARFGDRMTHDVQIRFATSLVTEVMKALRSIPNLCPHCKTNLDIRQNLGQTLLELSKTFEENAMKS